MVCFMLFCCLGSGRICEHTYRYAVSSTPDLRPVWYGLHPGLHRLPRACYDVQGVHAVCDSGRWTLVGRPWTNVLQCEGRIQNQTGTTI